MKSKKFQRLREEFRYPFKKGEIVNRNDKIFWYLKIGVVPIFLLSIFSPLDLFHVGYLAAAAFFYRPEYWNQKLKRKKQKHADFLKIIENHNVDFHEGKSDLSSETATDLKDLYVDSHSLDLPYLSTDTTKPKTLTLKTEDFQKAKKKAYFIAILGYFLFKVIQFIAGSLLILFLTIYFYAGEGVEMGFIETFWSLADGWSELYAFEFTLQGLGLWIPLIMLLKEYLNRDLYAQALSQKTLKESETKTMNIPGIEGKENSLSLKMQYLCDFCNQGRYVTSVSCLKCGSKSAYVGKENDRNNKLFYLYSVFAIWFLYRGGPGIYMWLNPPDLRGWNLFVYNLKFFTGWDIERGLGLFPSLSSVSVIEIIIFFVGLILARHFIKKH